MTETKVTNQIQVAKPPQLAISEIMTIGKAFLESGMFPDVKSIAQAVVKIQAGQEFGIAPFAAMSGIFIIQGRPTVGAGIIASKVKSSGKYNFKVIKHDETVCSIDFYEGKDVIGNSTFTIADAQKAGTKNLEKFPKNMLFARAISNGQKWFASDVFNSPVYTPEELSDIPQITEDIEHEELIPDHWNKKLAVCKTPVDVDALAKKHFDTVKANPKLQELFKVRKLELESNPVPETTMHNHKEIVSNGLPLISNGQYKLAMQRIVAGELDVYYKVKANYSLESTQSRLLDEAYATAKNKKQNA